MGYYTKYVGSIHDNFKDAVNTTKYSNSCNAYDASRDLYKTIYDMCIPQKYLDDKNPLEWLYESDYMKWYENEFDMTNLSIKYPELYFRIDGEGEDSCDQWRSIYHNGKETIIHVRMEWDDFDII